MNDTGLHIEKMVIQAKVSDSETSTEDDKNSQEGVEKENKTDKEKPVVYCETGLTDDQLRTVLTLCRETVEARIERYVER